MLNNFILLHYLKKYWFMVWRIFGFWVASKTGGKYGLQNIIKFCYSGGKNRKFEGIKDNEYCIQSSHYLLITAQQK